MSYLRHACLIIYNVVIAYFLGLLIFWTLPVPRLPWQFSFLMVYVIGAVISSLLSFLIFKKWRAQKATKIVVAVIVLIIAVSVSYVIVTERSETFTARAHQYMQEKHEN